MAICWERAVPLAFHLCCFYFSVVLIVGFPFPFDVEFDCIGSRLMWNSIVTVPDHCLFIYFTQFWNKCIKQNRNVIDLTHICLLDFSILIKWTSQFPVLGVSGILFHLYLIFNRNKCKQIGYLRRLIWVCTVCL